MESDDKRKVKKMKRNICPACLGILEDSTMEEFVSNIIPEDIEYYKSIEFVTMISLPKCFMLRNYSIYLHLKNLFPDIIKEPFDPVGR